MNFTLELTNGTGYRPGDDLTGTVSWDGFDPPDRGTIELSWTTQGKGDTDTEVVATVDIPALKRPGESAREPLEARDEREFSIPLPDAPYSFSGSLISVTWTLRARIEPGEHERSIEVTISPTGAELRLRLQDDDDEEL